eukprot:15310742-Alexandrium_andersonii.AAC.2
MTEGAGAVGAKADATAGVAISPAPARHRPRLGAAPRARGARAPLPPASRARSAASTPQGRSRGPLQLARQRRLGLSPRGGRLIGLGIQEVARGLRAVGRQLRREVRTLISPNCDIIADSSAARARRGRLAELGAPVPRAQVPSPIVEHAPARETAHVLAGHEWL